MSAFASKPRNWLFVLTSVFLWISISSGRAKTLTPLPVRSEGSVLAIGLPTSWFPTLQGHVRIRGQSGWIGRPDPLLERVYPYRDDGSGPSLSCPTDLIPSSYPFPDSHLVYSQIINSHCYQRLSADDACPLTEQ